jgi:prepilin-type processing-associated H-X9-DG protein
MPPRFIQELLHPYVKNAAIWFCPSTGKNARWFDGSRYWPTAGYNGTNYRWSVWADPSTSPNAFSRQRPIQVSGLPIAAIPKPAEAPALYDGPWILAVKEPCISMFRNPRPAHARGLNVVYADAHAKFSPFANRPTPSYNPPCAEDWWADHNWQGFFE